MGGRFRGQEELEGGVLLRKVLEVVRARRRVLSVVGHLRTWTLMTWCWTPHGAVFFSLPYFQSFRDWIWISEQILRFCLFFQRTKWIFNLVLWMVFSKAGEQVNRFVNTSQLIRAITQASLREDCKLTKEKSINYYAPMHKLHVRRPQQGGNSMRRKTNVAYNILSQDSRTCKPPHAVYRPKRVIV